MGCSNKAIYSEKPFQNKSIARIDSNKFVQIYQMSCIHEWRN